RIPGIVRQPLDVSDQGGEPVYGRRVHLSGRLETTDPTQSRHGLGCDLTVSDRSAGPRLREARGLPLENRYRRARGDHQDLFSPARARDLPVEAPATHRPGQVMDRVRRERIGWSPPRDGKHDEHGAAFVLVEDVHVAGLVAPKLEKQM